MDTQRIPWSVAYFFFVGQTSFPMQKIYDDPNTITLFFTSNDYIHWYWNDNDLDKVRNSFLKNIKKDKNHLINLEKDWQRKINNFEIIIKKVAKTDLDKLNNEQLATLYDYFYKAYLDEFSYFMALGDAISMHADRYLVPEFKKVLGDKFNDVFPKLITTEYVSFIEEEQADRYKLIKYLEDGKEIPENKLKKHSDKYFYIYNNYAKVEYLSTKYFADIIQQDFKQPVDHKPSKTREEILEERNNLIEEWKLSDWHRTLIYIMDKFFAIQDIRKKYVLISNYYQFDFLRQAEKRTNLPFNLLTYTIYPEFRDVLASKISVKTLQERKKICVYIQTPNSYEVITGKVARDLLDFYQAKKNKSDELKGTLAFKGKAKGVVKIILKVHDMVNMDDGDILVSSMTRPEMAPAMKRAGAIITDEGGITCHAAIVARELGIPCIIGTKIATKVLKDGDKVEVDAVKGIVKKI